MSSSCFHIFSASAASFGSIPAKGPAPLDPLPPPCIARRKGRPVHSSRNARQQVSPFQSLSCTAEHGAQQGSRLLPP